ncbi:hypothetical protein [Priestia taiwanensis]|uniref:Radical SAM protein n=1 Tax=Priestia taiwanensis TaxID=1347902 RepID=A0A917ERG1_9BACI|nr:hypothetical protein [Priestia taiwanensis]MBM7363446.1 hypothetical protein [Priestia taiwanensis]GGE77075.1 hypothetical protein GCM10007140_28450 [Priestia taiwanensis]
MYFKLDERLQIEIPHLAKDWDEYSDEEQQYILLMWESIRGKIPDRIFALEDIINEKQAKLSNETDFHASCTLNSEISDLASMINDLWLWYRTNQDISDKRHL